LSSAARSGSSSVCARNRPSALILPRANARGTHWHSSCRPIRPIRPVLTGTGPRPGLGCPALSSSLALKCYTQIQGAGPSSAIFFSFFFCRGFGEAGLGPPRVPHRIMASTGSGPLGPLPLAVEPLTQGRLGPQGTEPPMGNLGPRFRGTDGVTQPGKKKSGDLGL
jgi:hypothetical protein